LSIITSAIREGTFDVIDLRAKDGKMQYN